MSSFTAIDLSQLPPPDVLETLDFETILQAMVAELLAEHPEYSAFVESDPAMKLLEVAAYRELLLRQRINEAARSVLLAFAQGADLDHLGALPGVQRLDDESDDKFRARIQLSLEGFSTAGPVGAYEFHALSASASVKAVDISAPVFTRIELNQAQQDALPPGAIALQVDDDAGLEEPMPGDVAVTVLANTGSGVPSASVLADIDSALSADAVRPLTDRPRIRAAEIVEYNIEATLSLEDGPDTRLVVDAAYTALNAYVVSAHALGKTITLSAIYAALHQPGVDRVTLVAPNADIEPSATQAAYCTGIQLSEV